MLEESCKLSFAVVRDIFDHGFSRVPVYARERQHVVGLLFVKDLIFVDPEDEVPLAEYLRVFERSIELVDAEANLDDVLRIFKRGRGHLALVLGPVWKSKFYGTFVLHRRVDLHAIDATPARWRDDAGSSPLD